MASSFITKDGTHGFWVNDSLMQIACWGFVNVIDNLQSNETNNWLKEEFRNLLYDNSQGVFVGFMHLRLNEYLINEDRKMELIDVLRKARIYFKSKGNFITNTDLNDFQLIKETKREWSNHLDTNRIFKILNFLEDLVNDKIKTKDSDSINYEF